MVYTKQLAEYRASLGLIQQGQLADNTGDVSREENDKIRNAQQRSDFLQQVMFKNPKDNYLFSQGERVYLFNTDESSIETYNADGTLTHQAAANYLDHEDWEDKVIQDRKTGLFYGLLRSTEGYALAAIDPESGELGTAVPLHIGFYEKIVVYNFQAYVLGTPLHEGTKGIDRLYVKGLR